MRKTYKRRLKRKPRKSLKLAKSKRRIKHRFRMKAGTKDQAPHSPVRDKQISSNPRQTAALDKIDSKIRDIEEIARKYETLRSSRVVIRPDSLRRPNEPDADTEFDDKAASLTENKLRAGLLQRTSVEAHAILKLHEAIEEERDNLNPKQIDDAHRLLAIYGRNLLRRRKKSLKNIKSAPILPSRAVPLPRHLKQESGRKDRGGDPIKVSNRNGKQK
jgi:hypothetical protein